MTFGDILFKLLPFTYIDKETGEVEIDVLDWSKYSDGDLIITSVEIFIISLFLYFFVSLWFSWWRDRSKIVVLLDLLEKYKKKNIENSGKFDISAHYSEFHEEVNNTNDSLSKLWREFDESLVKKYDKKGDFLIRNSIDADYFFNKKSMINHLGSKLYASIPGVLLGIGLLGTFVGLYFALIQLNVSDAEVLQESIKILINMVGVKFAASIWGLGLSVFFTIVDKILEFRLESKVTKIQLLINQQFIRETAEQNLDSILDENKEQTEALKGLATSLTEKIAVEFNTMLVPKVDLMNQHFEQMPHHISKAISSTFEEPLEKLSSTVANLTTDQAEKSNEALETMMKEFIHELKSAAGDEGKKMQEASVQSQEILKSTSQHLETTFNSMQDIISKQEESSKQRESDINLNVNELLSNMETSSKKQLEDDNYRNEVIIKMLEELSSQNKQLMIEMASTVSNQMGDLNNNTSALFEKIMARFDDHIDRVKENVDSIISNLKTEVNNIDAIMSSASKQLVSLPSHLSKVSESADKLTQFSADMSNTASKLVQFNEGFEKTQEGLNQYSENISAASGELREAEAHFKEMLLSSKTVLDTMRTEFKDLSDANSDTIDKFAEKVNKFMNDYQDSVSDAINNGVIKQLDNAFGEFASEMAEAVTDLSEAVTELREKDIR